MRNVEFCSPSKAFACSILLLTAVCCGLAARPAKSQSEGMRYMDIVERLRSDDPAVRLTASRALIKAGGLATPELMRKLRDSLRQEPFEKRERTSSYTLELMNVLAETLERQPEVVSVFRNNDDCELAKALVKLATSNDKTTRGLATIILANSIDNTTLPLVTAEVQKKGLNNSSLLNLLGIIRIKADYEWWTIKY